MPEGDIYILRSSGDAIAAAGLLARAREAGVAGLEGIEERLRSEMLSPSKYDAELNEYMQKTGIHQILVRDTVITKEGLVAGRRLAGLPFPYTIPREYEYVFSEPCHFNIIMEGLPADEQKRQLLQEYRNRVITQVRRMPDKEAGWLYKQLLESGDTDLSHHIAIGVEYTENWRVYMSDTLARGLWRINTN